MKCAPRLPGCGTQHPHRALGGTRVLLAAAPTTPPCFRRWRRSSLLQRKNYFYFRASGASADAPLALFHGRSRKGKRQLPRLFPEETVARRGAPSPSPSSLRDATSPKGRGKSAAGNFLVIPNTLVLNFTAWLPPLGELARERLRGRISLLFVPNSTFWRENRKRLSKMHKKTVQSLEGTALAVPGRKNFRNRKMILNESSPQNKSLRKQIK